MAALLKLELPNNRGPFDKWGGSMFSHPLVPERANVVVEYARDPSFDKTTFYEYFADVDSATARRKELVKDGYCTAIWSK